MADLPLQMDIAEFGRWRQEGRSFQLLDVREQWEHEVVAAPGDTHIPMGEVPARLAEIARDRPVVVMCHHGGRSMQVTRWLRAQGFAQAINLAGGIDSYARELDPSLPTY